MPPLAKSTPTVGTIQWKPELAVQANRNRPVGIRKLAATPGIRRTSGSRWRPSRTAGSTTTWRKVRSCPSRRSSCRRRPRTPAGRPRRRCRRRRRPARSRGS
ncbi:hypothetical protein VTK73DRAFT_2446 [Phialemonium thermophilum]|uniref:Uncharacterized protein n=1 Tax=Phialemonium thermophilum TaxID=223376 RepID=A0ABR3VS31_9PEZI